MFKLMRVIIGLGLFLTVTHATLAQEPVVPEETDPFWQASYWSNMTLSGTPVLQHSESILDHDWGTGSPHPGIPADGFSARWTRYIDVSAGTYRFTATSDDGIRVYVDGELIISDWSDHPAKTVSVEKQLNAGYHLVVVEYYENGGLAVAKLSWAPASAPIANWRGEYFNNTTLSGAPVLVRDDANVNFEWGNGSPSPSVVSADRFSVRWTRTVNLPAGNYRFSMTVDDGGRLWVNNRLLIDAWRDQAERTYTGDIYLPGGAVPIKMEYYENGGLAVAKLSWTSGVTPITNWRGEYFNNTTLSGAPALTRDDANIDFDWGNGSPAPSVVSADRFSVRWTRTLDLPAGHYRFSMTVDDGGRLWINDRPLIEAWRDQAARTYSGDIFLAGGATPIKMEYYENGGLAVARLSWTRSDTPPDTPPAPGTVYVDDTDAGFVKGGSSTGWRTAYEGYGGRLTWTRNNDSARPNYNWARWYPSLSAGRYEVFVYIPERYTTTAQARYWVSHASDSTLRIVNQNANGNRWVSLGTYWFDGSGNDYVSLADVTYEVRMSRLVAFDAVKWVPR